ncbi:hypothetical protein Goshw_017587 [Gossypium schwendimanii]|uniref:DUF4283 domain-containing protein n=1 Tax=Gossypium schwendimanii TaxID=34291 RepID=A0A7J9NH59_GOSSC|nr:hypothetical protein [Gossypium schwendimanii]
MESWANRKFEGKKVDDEDTNLLDGDVLMNMKPEQLIQLMDLENDYFIVKFQLDEYYWKVLSERSWVIFGQYLTIQLWSASLSTCQPYPLSVVA